MYIMSESYCNVLSLKIKKEILFNIKPFKTHKGEQFAPNLFCAEKKHTTILVPKGLTINVPI